MRKRCELLSSAPPEGPAVDEVVRGRQGPVSYSRSSS